MKKINIYIAILAILSILTGCIEEDPNLVNPPPKSDRVYIRFINLSGDRTPKKLGYDDNTSTNFVNYGKSSIAAHPPTDSSHLYIINANNQIEYKSNRIVKFSPNITYSYVSLPGPISSSNPKSTDTIFAISTSLAMPYNATESYLKLVNLYPDSTINFSLIIGCPGATPLFSGVRYLQQTPPQFVRTGKLAYTIIAIKNQIPQIVGTYSISTQERGQYAVVIAKNEDNSIGVFNLDELNLKSDAFSLADMIEQKYTNLRFINISANPITLIHNNKQILADNQAPLTISNSKQIEACQTQSKDTLSLIENSKLIATELYSFEVLENYFVVAADSGNAKKMLIVPPTYITNFENKSLIRVVNLAWDYPDIDVSIGSRASKDNTLGYTSGIAIVKNLKYGRISPAVLIEPGKLPLAIFTSFEPTEMVDNSNTFVEKNKEYLLLISQNQNGELTKFLVESSQTNLQLENLEKTSFVQILNAFNDVDDIEISINSDISNGKLFYSNVLSTNIPYADNTITIKTSYGTKNIMIYPKNNNRYVLILCGSAKDLDYVLLENNFERANPNFAKIRFINTINDIQLINVVENIKDTTVIAQLPYKEFTFYNDLDKVKRYTYYFFDNSTKKSILNFNLEVTMGKKYSLILAGGKNSKNKYSTILLQDY